MYVGRIGGSGMDKKKALGRGMASLIPDASLLKDEAAPQKTFFYCDIENVLPNKEQPRKVFNDKALEELSISIKEKGILQPILVRRLSDFQYEIIAGERRWRAAQKAGLTQIPVIIRESSISGRLEEALIENLQREDLNPLEEAQAFQKLIEDYEYTQEEVARKIGKERSTVTNSLRLLALSETVKALVLEGKLSAGHARALLSLDDPKKQESLAQEIIRKELSVRQTEKLVKGTPHLEIPRFNRPQGSQTKDPYLSTLEQELSQHFKSKVTIASMTKKGMLTIEFYGEEDLNRILGLLRA